MGLSQFIRTGQTLVSGDAHARGSIDFDDSSSGAFTVNLDDPIVPGYAEINVAAIRDDLATGSVAIQSSQLPSTAPIQIFGDAGNDLTVNISSFSEGQISGTVTVNNLVGGESARMSIVAVV